MQNRTNLPDTLVSSLLGPLREGFHDRHLNLPFAQWTDVFGDAALTAALLDRLTHHSLIHPFDWESIRFTESWYHSNSIRFRWQTRVDGRTDAVGRELLGNPLIVNTSSGIMNTDSGHREHSPERNDGLASQFIPSESRFSLPAQPVDATHALNVSAGVANSSVLRGRSLSCRATASKCSCECSDRFVLLGK